MHRRERFMHNLKKTKMEKRKMERASECVSMCRWGILLLCEISIASWLLKVSYHTKSNILWSFEIKSLQNLVFKNQSFPVSKNNFYCNWAEKRMNFHNLNNFAQQLKIDCLFLKVKLMVLAQTNIIYEPQRGN